MSENGLQCIESQLYRPTGYRYKPLKSQQAVRLLALKSGTTSAPIIVSLAEACIDDDPDYEAISYTWATEDGDDERSRLISCDGGSIRVTPNCETVLRRFRKSAGERILWIDAICINQDDIAERGHQVQLMGKVYSKAGRVLVWLGESPKCLIDPENSPQTSECAFKCLQDIADEIRDRRHNGETIYGGPCYENFIRMRSRIEHGTETCHEQCRLLDRVFLLRWWNRLWIVQEVVLAKSAVLICGDATIAFTVFLEILDGFCEEASPTSIMAFSFLHKAFRLAKLQAQIYNREEMSSLDIEELIIKIGPLICHGEASDPRDNVFGFLGLLNYTGQFFLSLDYSNTISTVFTEATKAVIANTNSLDILRQSVWPSGQCNLPSWAFDWSPKYIETAVTFRYRASNGSKAIYRVSNNDMELQVKATIISRVREVANQVSPLHVHFTKEHGLKTIRIWRQWHKLALSLTPYHNKEDLEHALWRTLSWASREPSRLNRATHVKPNFDAWYKITTSTTATPAEIESALLGNQDAMLYADHSLQCNVNRVLCTTIDDRMAMVPVRSQPDDQIVLFAGGSTPFVVHRVGEYHILIGACYLDGVMYGEAFPTDESELDWFKLR